MNLQVMIVLRLTVLQSSFAVKSVAMSDVVCPDEEGESETQNHSATENYHKICAVALLLKKI